MCCSADYATLEAHGLHWKAATGHDKLRRYTDQLGRNVGTLDVHGLEHDDVRRLDAAMLSALDERARRAEREAR